MKMNMKEWVAETIRAEKKKAAPILSFPGIQITGHTVDEMVRDGHLQALCMEAIAKRFPTGAGFQSDGSVGRGRSIWKSGQLQ